jgi:hypothetical protein
MSDPPNDRPASRALHPSRRLSDKILIAFNHILIAFNQACDQRELEVAEQLLAMLEMIVSPRLLPPGAMDLRGTESLVAAYERILGLRNP